MIAVLFKVFLQRFPARLTNFLVEHQEVCKNGSTYIHLAGGPSDYIHDALVSTVHFTSKLCAIERTKQNRACDLIAESLNFIFAPVARYSTLSQPEMCNFVQGSKTPACDSILPVNDDVRCKVVGKSETSEHFGWNRCMMASEIAKQQHENAFSFNLFTEIRERISKVSCIAKFFHLEIQGLDYVQCHCLNTHRYG